MHTEKEKKKSHTKRQPAAGGRRGESSRSTSLRGLQTHLSLLLKMSMVNLQKTLTVPYAHARPHYCCDKPALRALLEALHLVFTWLGPYSAASGALRDALV